MELALTIFNVGAGVGIALVGAAVAYLAWRLTPLIAETRELTRDLQRLSQVTETELRPLLDRAREVTRSAEVLTDDAAVEVARLTETLNALEDVAGRGPSTLAPHRAAAGSVESAHIQEEQADR